MTIKTLLRDITIIIAFITALVLGLEIFTPHILSASFIPNDTYDDIAIERGKVIGINNSEYNKEVAMFRVLLKHTRLKCDPQFAVEQSQEVNAYATPGVGCGRVTITTGMLGFFRYNPDAIANILAHELSHIIYGDVWTRKHGQYMEKRADLLGQKIAMYAGYSPCGAVEGIQMFLNVYGDIPEGLTYPPFVKRIEYLMPMCLQYKSA